MDVDFWIWFGTEKTCLLKIIIDQKNNLWNIFRDGRYLISGSHDGDVLVWDTLAPPAMLYPESDPVLKPVTVFPAHNDTVNGVR